MDLLVRRRLLIAGTGSIPLPYDAEVEFLESADGNQYIDCGFLATDQITMAINAIRKSNSVRFDCGSQTSWTSNVARLLIDTTNYGYWQYGSTAGGGNFSNGVSVGSFNLSINHNAGTITNIITGSSTSFSSSGSTPFITPGNFGLFVFYLAGSGFYPASEVAGLRIVNAKLTDTGVNLDFIPVRVGNTGYLYERNSGQLYGNQGTGSFLLGPDKSTIPNKPMPSGATAYDYILVDGTQYFDSGVGVGESSADVDIRFNCAFTSNPGNWRWPVTCILSNDNYFGIQSLNTKEWRVFYGSSSTPTGTLGLHCQKIYFEIKQGVMKVDSHSYNIASATYIDNIKICTAYLSTNNFKGRLYRTQIWIGGTLVRDFQPCTDSNNVGAMYDHVGGQFYYGDNASGNAFIAGNDAF